MILSGFLFTIGVVLALVVITLLLCTAVWFEENT